MESARFIIYNNNLIPESEPVLKVSNRSFRYGDGLFESIRIINGKAFALKNHLERLKADMAFLKMNRSSDFEPENLSKQISNLLEKNKIKEGGKLRLTVFREDGGLYSPENNNVSYFLEGNSLPDNYFLLNKKGLTLDIYNDIRKPLSRLSSVKSNNSLIYVLASIYKNEKSFDDCLILNEEGNIAEATSSNLFMVSENKIYTPCLEQACLAGTMRKQVVELAKESGYIVYQCNLTPEDLMEAGEVFLTNAVSGIRWVSAFKNKRYFNSVAAKLINQLNQKAAHSHSNSNSDQ